MRPTQAYRIADLLGGMNIFLGICIVTLGIKLAVVWTMPEPEEKEALLSKREEKKEIKKNLSEMEICWKAAILEPEPEEKKEEKKIKPEEKKSTSQTTLAWCSVFVHPDPQKSMAILLDTRKGNQTVCKIGDILEKQFQVLEITFDWIKIGWKDHYALIKRPCPTLGVKNAEKQEK